MTIDDDDTKFPKVPVSCRRQCQSIADPLALLIGTGDDVERRCEVGGGSRERADHGKVAVDRQRWVRWPVVSAKRD
jgi:hypothetical protein